MNETHRIGNTGADFIDTTAQDWGLYKKEVPIAVLEQQALDALAYPDLMGEYS